MSSNVIICPKKWFSDEGGMSANRGKAGQKEICDKKKEKRYVWQEKEQAEQTMRNHAERRELKPLSSHGFFYFCEKILVRPIPRTVHVGFRGG